MRVNSIICRLLSIVQKMSICLFVLMFILAMDMLLCTSTLNAAGRFLPKRYVLQGDLSLTYEKKWIERAGADSETDRFMHNYGLGISGFIIDPRLITFDIDGTLSEEIVNPGQSLHSYGISTSMNVLNKPARRGFFSHFPQPIVVTFGYLKAEFNEIRNYGISLGYDLFERMRIHRQFQQQQQRQQFRRQQQIMQQINENNNNQQNQVQVQRNNLQLKRKIIPLPLPVVYFDYDNYHYSLDRPSNSLNIDTDFLNLRLVDRNDKTDYIAEYNYRNSEGSSVKSETQYLTAEVNYRDYWEEKRERFESYNRLDLSDDGNIRGLRLSIGSLWGKNLGKDLKDDLAISGGVSYFTSDDKALPENYLIKARSEYTKNFVKKWSRFEADVNYGDSGVDEIYLVRVSNETQFNLSRRLSLTGRGNIGKNELGELYGAGVGLWVWTFVSITPRYNFSRNAASEGRTTNHDFSIDMQGRISRNITFNSRNSYNIKEISGIFPLKEEILDLRSDFFWTLPFMNINLGVSRLETTKSERNRNIIENELVEIPEEVDVDLDVTSIYSNLSGPLSRRAFLSVNNSYVKEKNQETLNIRPIITWNLRQTSLNIEYGLRLVSGERDFTEHRVFFRLTRSFAKRLRKFW